MSSNALRLASLSAMADDDKLRALDALKANGVPESLDAAITALEARYEMSSSTMLAKWKRGELRDTADFARWLVLLRARGDK